MFFVFFSDHLPMVTDAGEFGGERPKTFHVPLTRPQEFDYLQSSSPPACDMTQSCREIKNKKEKKKSDILHSRNHSTKYNNFLEFFDPRRRSQGTSCCPRSTSCSMRPNQSPALPWPLENSGAGALMVSVNR